LRNSWLGQRLIGHLPWGYWRTTTFVAGLRHDRIVVPLVPDGAMNGQASPMATS
jgi:hypothetical protein